MPVVPTTWKLEARGPFEAGLNIMRARLKEKKEKEYSKPYVRDWGFTSVVEACLASIRP